MEIRRSMMKIYKKNKAGRSMLHCTGHSTANAFFVAYFGEWNAIEARVCFACERANSRHHDTPFFHFLIQHKQTSYFGSKNVESVCRRHHCCL